MTYMIHQEHQTDVHEKNLGKQTLRSSPVVNHMTQDSSLNQGPAQQQPERRKVPKNKSNSPPRMIAQLWHIP